MVTEVKGFGRQKGHTEFYRGAEYDINFIPKIQLEIILSNELTDEAVSIIREKARTGEIGDGKIFVSSIDNVMRIRTRESGKEAI